MLSCEWLYNRIKSIANERGIMTGKMLEVCGLNNNQLATIKNGTYPNLKSIGLIADYLGVSLSYLLSENEDDVIASSNATPARSLNIASRFDELDADGQIMVSHAIIQEERRIAAEKEKAESKKSDETKEQAV